MSGYSVLVLVLSNPAQQDKLLLALKNAGIKGATVIHSTGMAHALGNLEEDNVVSSLRAFFSTSHVENKTIFMVLKDEKIRDVRTVITSVLGDLSKPDTGILFAFPLTLVEGILE
ncbi:MAG: hypothetical protein IJC25_06790 [Clostridia bacterium]|nr:hypothetical protein [Clostridia bacterium]